MTDIDQNVRIGRLTCLDIYTSLTKDLYNLSEYHGEINLIIRDTVTKVYSLLRI